MKSRWVKVAAAVLIFAVLLWLSVQGSSSRLRKKVEQYKAQLREAGEKTTVEEITPAPVPAERNALALFQSARPALKWTGSDCLDTNLPSLMQLISPGRAIVGFQQPDIRTSEGTNDWKDLRAALNRRGPVLNFVREAPAKDRLQFDLDYSRGGLLSLSHCAELKRSAQIASAAVLCDLHQENTASAVTNLHGGLAVVRLWNREPLLISQLVRFSMLQILYSAQWEILQSPHLSDSELALLQSDWKKLELLDSVEAAMVGERVFGSLIITQIRSSNSPPDLIIGTGTGSSGSSGDWWEALKDHGRETRDSINFALWKSSWSYEDELFLLQANQAILTALRQCRTNGFYKDALTTSAHQMDSMLDTFTRENRMRFWMKDEMTGSLISPAALGRALNKLMATEAAKQLAITAIALKRFELKHKEFPARLEELVPDFVKTVPRDPVDGQPLRYRLNNDHTFALYSIGENGIDDGGSATNATASKSFGWQRGIDWVWPQPATPAEVEAFFFLQKSGY